MDRPSQLQDKIFDLIIIGGGIVGSGIARDAALRGLSVALFEKNDYCSGTTARSTRLIHGGLRYLETLDFTLVRLDLREREVLLRIAKHLVKPLPFLIPFYNASRAYRCKVNLGMMLYDLLSLDKSLPVHRRLTRREMIFQEPLLGFSQDQGCKALPGVIACMGAELNWSAAKKEEEFEVHMQWVRQTKLQSDPEPS